jgi:hypothetical protein
LFHVHDFFALMLPGYLLIGINQTGVCGGGETAGGAADGCWLGGDGWRTGRGL